MSTTPKLYATLQRASKRTNGKGLAPIHLRITLDVRGELATGIFCPEAYWSKQTQKLALPTDKSKQVLPEFSAEAVDTFNDALYQFRRKVEKLHERLQRPDLDGPLVAVTTQALREALRGPKVTKQQRERERVGKSLLALYDAFITERGNLIGVEIAAATDLSHKTRYNRLAEYLQAHSIAGLRPESFTLNHADKLLHWLLKEKSYKRSSANKVVRGVSQVLGWGVRREYLAKNPLAHYEYKHPAKEPIKFLTVGELEAISCAELPTDFLGRVRDCFVFQCWTGLAYADVKALNMARDAEYHTDKAGNMRRVLRVTRAKSTLYKGYECVIPLLPEAERLLAHYEDQIPVLTNAYYNRALKELGQLCGVKAEKMTTHVGRKTAGTLLLNMGVALPVVSKFLGHTNVLITQRLYAELLDTTVVDAFAQLGGYAAPEAGAMPRVHELTEPVALRPARRL